MLQYLFHIAPPMLFEALAITMLIGFAVLLFLRKKKNPVLFWSFTGIILFMIIWRLSVHSLMLSSRYAQILIYPCVILSACLCVNTQALFRWIFRKLKLDFPYRKNICKFLPAVLFVSLFFACIGKILHVDPHSNFIEKITNAYKKYADSKDHIHIAESEHNRISWYLKRKISDVHIFYTADDKPILDSVKRTIDVLKNIPGNHYLFFYLKKKETEPSARTMNFDKDSGSWEILERFYTSKRKNKEIILARYRPACPNVQEWNKPIPELPSNDIFKSVGNFEKALNIQTRRYGEKYFQKQGLKEYSDLSSRLLPNGWWFNLSRYHKKNPPDIRLSNKNPLKGRYSLFINTNNYRIGFNAWYAFKNCKVTFFIRPEGKKPTHVNLHLGSKNFKTNHFKTQKVLLFQLQPGKIYRIQKTVDLSKFPQGFQNLCPTIQLKGCATIDQFSIEPLPAKNNQR